MKKVFSFLLLAFLLSGCYRVPTEEDYSLIPMTNNHDFHNKDANSIPGLGI